MKRYWQESLGLGIQNNSVVHWASETGNVSKVRGVLVNVYFSLDERDVVDSADWRS